LICCYAIDFHSGEKEEYARLLNESPAYTLRKSHKEIVSVEEPTSNKEGEYPPKVELKPLPSHLSYEFLDSSH